MTDDTFLAQVSATTFIFNRAREARDEAIRIAVVAGRNRHTISSYANLSKPRIDQIAKGFTKGDWETVLAPSTD